MSGCPQAGAADLFSPDVDAVFSGGETVTDTAIERSAVAAVSDDPCVLLTLINSAIEIRTRDQLQHSGGSALHALFIRIIEPLSFFHVPRMAEGKVLHFSTQDEVVTARRPVEAGLRAMRTA